MANAEKKIKALKNALKKIDSELDQLLKKVEKDNKASASSKQPKKKKAKAKKAGKPAEAKKSGKSPAPKPDLSQAPAAE